MAIRRWTRMPMVNRQSTLDTEWEYRVDIAPLSKKMPWAALVPSWINIKAKIERNNINNMLWAKLDNQAYWAPLTQEQQNHNLLYTINTASWLWNQLDTYKRKQWPIDNWNEWITNIRLWYKRVNENDNNRIFSSEEKTINRKTLFNELMWDNAKVPTDGQAFAILSDYSWDNQTGYVYQINWPRIYRIQISKNKSWWKNSGKVERYPRSKNNIASIQDAYEAQEINRILWAYWDKWLLEDSMVLWKQNLNFNLDN